MKKIYFAGSIRGGRNDLELYKKIINYLQIRGEVLTEHIGDTSLTPEGEVGKSDQEIYHRDIDWLSESDVLVAEVSTPSLGVGFEIAKAVELNKKVLCLYRVQDDKKLSAMISGCPDIVVKEYHNFDEVKQIIDNVL
ncbi:MAG: nucleoside 2-deoxyribosyltransferase [Bacteroidota bacterium]